MPHPAREFLQQAQPDQLFLAELGGPQIITQALFRQVVHQIAQLGEIDTHHERRYVIFGAVAETVNATQKNSQNKESCECRYDSHDHFLLPRSLCRIWVDCLISSSSCSGVIRRLHLGSDGGRKKVSSHTITATMYA